MNGQERVNSAIFDIIMVANMPTSDDNPEEEEPVVITIEDQDASETDEVESEAESEEESEVSDKLLI